MKLLLAFALLITCAQGAPTDIEDICNHFPWLSSCQLSANRLVNDRNRDDVSNDVNAPQYCNKQLNNYNAYCLKPKLMTNQIMRDFCTSYYNKCKTIVHPTGDTNVPPDTGKSLHDWKVYCNQNVNAYKSQCTDGHIADNAVSFCHSYQNTCPTVIIVNKVQPAPQLQPSPVVEAPAPAPAPAPVVPVVPKAPYYYWD